MVHICNFLMVNFTQLLFNLLAMADAGTKIWRYTTSIMNPLNQEPAKNCEGIHFAPYNSAPINIEQMSTSLIELPISGSLDFSGKASIEINEAHKKCVKLKPLNYEEWYDYRSWLGDFNEATPHIERIPCFWDDVKFPKIIYTAVDVTKPAEIKSISLGSIPNSNSHWTLLLLRLARKTFINRLQYTADIRISKQLCDDPSGCICNPHVDSFNFCESIEHVETACTDPILPYGFCHEICGASITMKPTENFKIQQLKESISVDNEVQTHVSKIKNEYNEPVIQIVFAEHNYTGKSVEEATTFFNELLKKSRSYKVTDIKLLAAGISKIGGSSVAGIFFGTLMGVMATFVCIFYVYSDYNRWTRNRSLSGLYARFETRGSNVVIDEIGGSLVSVNQSLNSFENPLYGSPSTSTDTLKSDENLVKNAEE